MTRDPETAVLRRRLLRKYRRAARAENKAHHFLNRVDPKFVRFIWYLAERRQFRIVLDSLEPDGWFEPFTVPNEAERAARLADAAEVLAAMAEEKPYE